MERQYTALKQEVPECILFFRLGDFYEMFGEDAEVAAEILEITLTSRNKNSENPLPMCGIPYKAHERYLAKLLKAGKKVAIAEQVSDPSLPGIVERKIVRIITPGTNFSDGMLESKKNQFVCAFFGNEYECALAFCDITTGESFVEIFSDFHAAIRTAHRFDVAELLFSPDQFRLFSGHFAVVAAPCSRHFLPENAEQFLLKFFETKTLKGFGIENQYLGIQASALLFSYLEDTQKLHISHVTGIFLKDNAEKMNMDKETLKNLEIFSGSDGDPKTGLFHLMDETKTSMGGRALQRTFLQPFSQKKDIEERQEKIEWLLNDEKFLHTLQENLKEISDMERIVGKLATGRMTPRDFLALQKSLFAVEKIATNIQEKNLSPFEKTAKNIQNILKKN